MLEWKAVLGYVERCEIDGIMNVALYIFYKYAMIKPSKGGR
jgi:hypothetical protein